MRKSWTLAVVFFVALATVSCSDDDDAPKFAGSYEFQDEKTNLSWGVIWADDESGEADNGDEVYTHSVTLYSEGLGTDGLSGKGSYVNLALTTKETTLTPGTYVDKTGYQNMAVDFAMLQVDYDASDFESGFMYGISDCEVKVEGGTNGVYTITFSGKAYDYHNGSASSGFFDISGTYSGKLDVSTVD